MGCRVSTAKPSRCPQASAPVSHVDLTQSILTAALGGSWPLCWGHVEAERLPSQPGGRGSPDPGPPAFSPSLSEAVTLQGEGEG